MTIAKIMKLMMLLTIIMLIKDKRTIKIDTAITVSKDRSTN